MTDIRASCAIIVSSYDGFQDVWDPFFKLFFRFWPDCPFPVYLISNRFSYPDSRVRAIHISPDRGWASNMIEALGHVGEPYFLYLQEDYFLEKSADTARMVDLLTYLSGHKDIASIKLFAWPAPDRVLDRDMKLGEVTKGRPYRVSMQAALWSREHFLSLVRAGESGWDMEFKGSIRADRTVLVMASVLRGERPIRYYSRTAIKKGKWLPGALRLCRKEGIGVDLSRRPIISDRSIFWGDVRRCASVVLSRSGLRPAYARVKGAFKKKMRARSARKLYRSFVRPSDLCFDIGANVGDRTAIFSEIGAKVVALEPQSKCFGILEDKFAGCPDIILLRKAVGAKPGQAEIMESDTHTISSMSKEWIERVKSSGRFDSYTWSEPKSVEMTTLDELVRTYGVPAFCKIDVEGYESEVIKGLSVTIPQLSFEFTPEFLEPAIFCVRHLSDISLYEFNYSLGESMKLSLSDWVDGARIVSALKVLSKDSFGDVYARVAPKS